MAPERGTRRAGCERDQSAVERFGHFRQRDVAPAGAHGDAKRAALCRREVERRPVVAQRDVRQERELEQVLLGGLQGGERGAAGREQADAGGERKARLLAAAVAARLGAGALDRQDPGQVRGGQRPGRERSAEIPRS